MLIGYARVSDAAQSLDRQIDALTAHGVDTRVIYQEKATGTKRERPALERMLAEMQPGDVCVVSDLTRLSRSTVDLFDIAEKIRSKGADLRSLKESWLDTTTPQGKLMFTIFAGLSQFERDLISERTKEGLKAAKARGRSGGRPSKRNEKGAAVAVLYDSGMKVSEIVRQTGLSRSTVGRIVRDRALKTFIQ
jgi:DNA invertase Pin-like site-specific DNA recombinase